MSDTFTLDTTETVNDLVRRVPASLEVLHDLGIHTCCGGARPLAEAARQDGVDFDTLVAALERVLAPAAR